MIKKPSKQDVRRKRHYRMRNFLSGTPEKPRLAVFKSNKHIYAQIIDDTVGHTLVAASTMEKDISSKIEKTCDKQAAKIVGDIIGKRALEKGITTVVFDRGGFAYHGKIQILADSAREAGLKF